MTDTSIVQVLLRKNFKSIYESLEKNGASLYLNNAVNKWLLSIYTQGISEVYFYFIWDMFLLEGNIIIFKTIYAMIILLENDIAKSKSYEQLNNVFNEVPLGFNERGKLAYYLISKKFNFNLDMIKKYRRILSNQIIKGIIDLGFFQDNLEEEDSKINKKKNIICDLDWPLCSKDKKDLEKGYDHIVLRQLDEPCVIDNYFDNPEEYKKDVKEEKEDNKEDNDLNHFKAKRYRELLIERKKHFCGINLMSIRSNFPNSPLDLISIKETRTRTINLNNIERNKTINKIVNDIANDNQNIISFVKENEETGLLK